MLRNLCFVVTLSLLVFCGSARAADEPLTGHQKEQAIERAMEFMRRNQPVLSHQPAPEDATNTRALVEALRLQVAASTAGVTRVTVKGGVVEVSGGTIRITGADVLIEIPTGRR